MDMAKIRNSSVENMLAHFQVDTAWVINTGERKGGLWQRVSIYKAGDFANPVITFSNTSLPRASDQIT